MSKSDFWGKKDDISMARSLRLAVIQNLYDGGRLDEASARDCLNGYLSPDDQSHYYDDSDCLEIGE
jgi:hypothetical protein